MVVQEIDRKLVEAFAKVEWEFWNLWIAITLTLVVALSGVCLAFVALIWR